jgi:serine/threonine protein phosphatase PrpC
MHFITSAMGRNAAQFHTIAGLIIVLAVLWLGFEALTARAASAKRKRPARTPSPEPAPTPEPRPLVALPRAETESDDRDSSPEVPQVFLLCQEDVDRDESALPRARILVKAYGDSDAGKRRPRNEDSFLLLPDHSLYVVADGMGGYHGGKVASTLAVDTLKQAFEQTSFEDEFQSDAPIPRRGCELATALVKANRAVFQAAQADPALSEMGTTMVAARFSSNERRVYIGHVGDSRCYRFRGSTLTQLTTDHTMRHLGLEGPHANDLFRAVGIEQNVLIDLVIDVPRPEDVYLLCSDGLPKMVTDLQIEEALRGEADLESALYRLIELANDAGGRDNITVILVRVREQLQLDVDLSPDGERGSQSKFKAIKAQGIATGAARGSSQ